MVIFVNKRIYNFSPTLTVILAVVGHITWGVCISLHQFKSWILPFVITHAECIVGCSYAYIYCSIHYKIQKFL